MLDSRSGQRDLLASLSKLEVFNQRTASQTESFDTDADADWPIRTALCIGLSLQHPLGALAHVYNYYAAKHIITMLLKDAATAVGPANSAKKTCLLGMNGCQIGPLDSGFLVLHFKNCVYTLTLCCKQGGASILSPENVSTKEKSLRQTVNMQK